MAAFLGLLKDNATTHNPSSICLLSNVMYPTECPRKPCATNCYLPPPLQVLLACLAAVAAAAPQLQDGRPIVLVLRDDRVDNGDGNFNYAFEADNGIMVEASGTPGVAGQSNMQGVYR